MSLATAAPTDLETVKTAIRSMLDYHQQEAQRLETALSVLEQTFPLSAPLSEAGVIAGEDQNGSAQVSEAKSLVLNQADAKLLSESSNSPTASQKKSRKSKPTQAKASAAASEPVVPAPVVAGKLADTSMTAASYPNGLVHPTSAAIAKASSMLISNLCQPLLVSTARCAPLFSTLV